MARLKAIESRFGFRYAGYLQPNEGEGTANRRLPR